MLKSLNYTRNSDKSQSIPDRPSGTDRGQAASSLTLLPHSEAIGRGLQGSSSQPGH